MSAPHVHVPYRKVGEFIGFMKEHRINPEVYFRAGDFTTATGEELRGLVAELDYGPAFTVHAPFMDLCPAAVDPGIRRVTLERFSQTFDAAEALGARAIVFHSGYEKWKYAHNVDIWLEQSFKTWPEFIRRAFSIGATVAIENIFEDEPSNLVSLMRELGSEHFGICFDTGHMNLFSTVPLAEWLDALGEHIVELHLHDNLGDLDAHLPIGDGAFDFDALFKVLKGREDIVHTIEATSPEDALKSLEALKGYL